MEGSQSHSRAGKRLGRKPGRKTRGKILALIAADPSITMDELANRLDITAKGVEWQIQKMKRRE